MPAIVWKGFITFGLVSFPVRLFSAGRPETVHFHMLHRKDLSRVKEVWYCAEENKPIERADIVKGYETAKGKYVVIEDDELAAIAPATAETMEIVQFVHQAEVDPIFFESSYYIAPGEEISKPYVLFAKALAESKFHAIAKVSMHSREHVVLIRAAQDQLILHTLFYPDELHTANKPAVPAKANPSRGEFDLASELIRHLAAPFDPKQFQDTYRENVKKLIEEKKKGKAITAEPKPRRAPVVDLMEALKKSLQASAGRDKTKGRSKSSMPAAPKSKRRRKVA